MTKTIANLVVILCCAAFAVLFVGGFALLDSLYGARVALVSYTMGMAVIVAFGLLIDGTSQNKA